MSQYLVLSRINIQNANCIAGFTYGFPAITHFLGFTHALQRQLSSEFDIAFDGCSVVSHDYQLHVYKPSKYGNYEFKQSKSSYTFKPKFEDGKMKGPSIIEEGKMNLIASMIIEVSRELETTEEKIKQFKRAVLAQCLQNRLAGGAVLSIGYIDLFSASTSQQQETLTRNIKRLTMPGFVLTDRSNYLSEHLQYLREKQADAEQLDAWLDFSAMKYQAQPKLKENEESASLDTDADWHLIPKPQKGWLVPIMTGYKAISQVYPPGEVENTRDTVSHTCFVEAVHSIGEWRSMHRVGDISETIWKYQQQDDWYLCAQKTITPSAQSTTLSVESETIDFETAIADL